MNDNEPSIQQLLDDIRRKTIEQREIAMNLCKELSKCRAMLCFHCGNFSKDKVICSDCRYRDSGPWSEYVKEATRWN